MKKNILINIHYLEIGGAETSLIGLLHALDPSQVDVDLFINDPRGELMKYIPEWVNIIESPQIYRMIERPISEVIRRGYISLAASRLWAKYKFIKYFRKNRPTDSNAIFGYVGKYVTPCLPSLKHLKDYDVAISYVTPHNIVLDKVNAKKKLCWIHTDYSKIDVDAQLELPIWSGYDKVISISPDVTESFIRVFPSLKDKIVEIENFLPVELIRQLSMEYIPQEMQTDNSIIKILTIGRYSYPKRLEDIPYMAFILNKYNVRYKWYIIGYGNNLELEKITSNIRKYGVEESVILLGKKANPYPYIKACDIYVQPSRYEGKSITVREAQLLGKPVVITKYPTAASQIQDGMDGLIGPYETEQFSVYLRNVLDDFSHISIIKDSLKRIKLNQEDNLQKLTSLLYA